MPVPLLSRSHVGHLVLQLGVVRLPFAFLLLVRRRVGVVGLRQALGTRAGEQVVLPGRGERREKKRGREVRGAQI